MTSPAIFSEIWKKLFETGAIRLFNIIAGIISLSITARWLGPEGRGSLSALLAWVAMFGSIGSLSLGQAAIHDAVGKDRAKWLAEVLAPLIMLGVLISSLGLLVAAGLHYFSSGAFFRPASGVILNAGFLLLPAYILFRYGNALLMALNQISIVNRALVFSRIISIFLLIFFWQANFGLFSVIIAWLIGEYTAITIIFLQLFRETGLPKSLNLKAIPRLLKNGLKLHVSSLGSALWETGVIVLVAHYCGARETGYYQLAWQIVAVGFVISDAAAGIMYGKVVELGPKRAWHICRVVLIGTTVMVGIWAGICYMFAPQMISIIAGSQFLPSVALVRLLIIVLFSQNLVIMLYPFWIGMGLFRQFAFSTLLGGVSSVVLGMLLIPEYEISGAIWAVILSSALALVSNLLLILKLERAR